MNILSPDKVTKCIQLYHTNNKVLLPLTFTSFLLHNNSTNKNINSFAFTATTLSYAFHSYVSTSSIITDYIKPKNISKLARIININSHSISTIGIIYYLYNNNKNFV